MIHFKSGPRFLLRQAESDSFEVMPQGLTQTSREWFISSQAKGSYSDKQGVVHFKSGQRVLLRQTGSGSFQVRPKGLTQTNREWFISSQAKGSYSNREWFISSQAKGSYSDKQGVIHFKSGQKVLLRQTGSDSFQVRPYLLTVVCEPENNGILH